MGLDAHRNQQARQGGVGAEVLGGKDGLDLLQQQGGRGGAGTGVDVGARGVRWSVVALRQRVEARFTGRAGGEAACCSGGRLLGLEGGLLSGRLADLRTPNWAGLLEGEEGGGAGVLLEQELVAWMLPLR